MQNKKRLLSFLLSVMMLVSCFSGSAEAVAAHPELSSGQGSSLICELEETEGHTHEAECFCNGGEFLCGLEPEPAHMHEEACYDDQGELICLQEESAGHEHSEECTCPGGELICTMEESSGHTHGEQCYAAHTEDLPEEAPEFPPEEPPAEDVLEAPEAPPNGLILPEDFDDWMASAFPDINFRQAVIEQVYSDLDGDLSALTPEDVVGKLYRLDASNKGIRDITGVWYLNGKGYIGKTQELDLSYNLIQDCSILEPYVGTYCIRLNLYENPIHIFANNTDGGLNFIGSPAGNLHELPTYVGFLMDAVYVRDGQQKQVTVFSDIWHGNGNAAGIASEGVLTEQEYTPADGSGIIVQPPEELSFDLNINGDSGRIYNAFGFYNFWTFGTYNSPNFPIVQHYSPGFGYDFSYETYSTLTAEDENTLLSGFTFTKYNEDETKALPGARYQLLDAGGAPAQIVIGKDNDGTLRTAPVGESYTDPDSGDVYQGVLTTDENGEIKQKYLLPGRYTLTEVKAPEGYVLNGTPIPITVTAPIAAPFVIAGGEGTFLEKVTEDTAAFYPLWDDRIGNDERPMVTDDESAKTAADYGAELFIKNGGRPVSITDGYDSTAYKVIFSAETTVKLGSHPEQLFGSVEAAEECVNKILSDNKMQELDDNVTITSAGGIYYLKDSAEENHYQQSNEKTQLQPQEIHLKKYADIHRIWNSAAGTGLPDLDTLFYFTITDENGGPAVGSYRLADGTDPAQPIPENGEVSIKAGQEIIFSGLAAGDYTITERAATEINYNRADIFVQDQRTWDTDYLYDARTVTITVGETDFPSCILVEFTNYYSVGGLQISKSVTGTTDEEDLKKHFTFTVTLDDASINGTYGDMMCIETLEYTEIEFTDGVATFRLMDGEYANFFDIPSNIGYTVTETDNEGYTVVISGNATGVIPDTQTEFIIFENQKGSSSPSDFVLKITKDNVNGDKLSGAGFKLYTDKECTTLAGVFLDSGKTVSVANALPEQLMTDANGELRFYGLTEGSYFLKEFYTPSGYSLLNDPVPITIAADGTVTVSGIDKTPSAGEKEIAVRVTNDALILPLPATGLGGVAPFVGIGMAIMAASFMAMMISTKKHRRRA